MENSFYLHALHYHKLGMNSTCISNTLTEHNFYNSNILKVPCHLWKDLMSRRQSIEEMKNYPWGKATGVGIVTGFENIHVLDIDGCTNPSFVPKVLEALELPTDYEWVIQSGGKCGYHIYFYSNVFEYLNEEDVVSTFPPSVDFEYLFDKMEILWKTHAVLPPSLHNSGNEYSFVNCRIPKSKPTKIDITKFESLKSKYLNRSKEVKKASYSEDWIATENIEQPSNQDSVNLKDIQSDLYLVLDTETDGLIGKDNLDQPLYPSIVQLAWLIMDGEGIVYKKVSDLINCDFDSNSKAFGINKLNPEIIKKIGKKPQDIYKAFRNDLKYCEYVISHNIDFDVPIIKNELDKYGVDSDLIDKKKICTMKKSIPLFKTKFDTSPRYPKLDELFEKLFKYKVNQIHNAQADVLLTSKCFNELKKRELI